MRFHCRAHIVGHPGKSKKSAYGIRHFSRNDAIGFLHHEENRPSDFLGRDEFEFARRRGKCASVPHGRLLHGGAPQELPTLEKEPAGNAQLHCFLDCLLNPRPEALDAGPAKNAARRFRPMHRAFHPDYLSEKIRQLSAVDHVHIDISQAQADPCTFVGVRRQTLGGGWQRRRLSRHWRHRRFRDRSRGSLGRANRSCGFDRLHDFA